MTYYKAMNEEILQRVGKRFGDLSGLPDDLLKQIPAMRSDEDEQDFVFVLESLFDGVASIDEILIGMYRHTGRVLDRKKLSAKLYRMTVSDPPKLVSVEKKRGVYRLP
jgi:hypothetical protein